MTVSLPQFSCTGKLNKRRARNGRIGQNDDAGFLQRAWWLKPPHCSLVGDGGGFLLPFFWPISIFSQNGDESGL